MDYSSVSIRQGKFELCGNTVLAYDWTTYSTGLEICEWNDNLDKPYKWTIASFEHLEDESCYQLVSCVDRLNKINNWADFGVLVDKAYEILNDDDN